MLLKCIFILVVIARTGSCLDIKDRIVGGVSTTISKVPHQVAVLFGNFLCGGTLIAGNTVVTAAHCTAKSDELRANGQVRAGSTNYNKGGELISIDKIYDHPKYDPNQDDYDISILKLLYSFSTSSLIKPINIASSQVADQSIATVSGWGLTDPTDPTSVSENLNVLNIPIISTETCRTNTDYGALITNNMICAGYINKAGFDSCQGDSGGPLVYNNELVGIVSWGSNCAESGHPGVYVNVFSFKTWIEDTLNLIRKR